MIEPSPRAIKNLHLSLLLSVFFSFHFLLATPLVFGAEKEQLRYCDLTENPEKYTGERVTIRAVYNYGFEWQELLCWECRNKGRTWLTFHPDFTDKLNKQLRKAPRHAGIIIGRFTGVFHGRGGPYGDGGYPFEFEVEEVSEVKVLVRNYKRPLSEAVLKCGDNTATR